MQWHFLDLTFTAPATDGNHSHLGNFTQRAGISLFNEKA